LATSIGCHGDPAWRQRRPGGRSHECDPIHLAFNLRVEQCQEPVGLVAQFTFGTKADGVAGQPDLFTLDGPTNVGLELGDEYKRNVSPGVPSRLNALGSGKAYTFHARLRETQATVRGGMFSRAVNVLVEFR
jgi:type 1 fimbria pilin